MPPSPNPDLPPVSPSGPAQRAEREWLGILFIVVFGVFVAIARPRLVLAAPDALQPFVAATVDMWAIGAGALLSWFPLLYRRLQSLRRPGLAPPTRSEWSMAMVALLASGAAAIHASTWAEQEGHAQRADVQGMAAMKADDLHAWLGERANDVELIEGNPYLSTVFTEWRGGSTEAGTVLATRLDQLRRQVYVGLAVVDLDGSVLLAQGAPPSPTVAEAAGRAARAGTDGPLADAVDPGVPLLPFTALLRDESGTVLAAVVLQADSATGLLPRLATWVGGSPSAGIAILQKDAGGDHVLWTSNAWSAGALGVGAADSGGSSSAVVKAEAAVAGTPFAVVAVADEREVDAPMRQSALWSGVAASFAIFGIVASSTMLRRQQSMELEGARSQEAAERTRVSGLLHAIAEQSSDAIFVKDKDGRYLLYNPAAGRVAGRPPEEVLGRDDREIFPMERARRMRDEDAYVMREGRLSRRENVLPVNGELRTFEVTKGPLRDENGAIYAVFGISRDVTERRRTEQELLRTIALVQAIQDSVAAGIVVLDRDGAQIAANEAGRRDGAGFGLSWPVAATGATHAPDAATVAELEEGIRRVLSGEVTGFQKDYACRGPAQTRWCHLNVTPLRTAEGGAVIVQTDISERKWAELAQAQSEERLELALEAGRIGVWEWDEENGAFYRSPEAERVFGEMEVGPTRLRAFLQRVDPRDRATLDPSGRTSGDPVEYRYERPDGSVVWLVSAARGIRGEDGHLRRVVGTVRDISEEKAVAAELARARDHLEERVAERTAEIEKLNEELSRRAAEAEAATHAKSAFLANVSHEIRTPMNAVIGFTHLLRRDEDDSERRVMLGKISDAAHHLLGIISDVLDLSKIEADKLSLASEAFELRALVDRAVALVSQKAAAKGLRVDVERGDTPPWLRGDPTRLSQALVNYLGNAVKFTDHGRVVVRWSVVPEATPDEQTVLVRFEVEDTGIGISQSDLTRLFNAFEQADTSLTRQHGGTGLGLAITRSLARRMGGEAGAESTPGQGSRFWFSVRLARAEPPSSRPAEAPRSRALPMRGGRVLVAEDNLLNQEVIRALLTSAGLDVTMAGNGEEALTQAEQGVYDLILMDVQMPQMDGLTATRRLRETVRHRATPILALTANAFGSDRAACIDAGMNDHISKPLDPDAFFETLTRWLPGVSRG